MCIVVIVADVGGITVIDDMAVMGGILVTNGDVGMAVWLPLSLSWCGGELLAVIVVGVVCDIAVVAVVVVVVV